MSSFRRRLMMAAASSVNTKPYDAEVEYLVFDGNAYTTLPIRVSEVTDRLYMTFRLTDLTYQQRFASAYNEDIFNLYINGSGRVGFSRDGSWKTFSSNDATKFDYAKHKLKLFHYVSAQNTGWEGFYDFLEFNGTETSDEVATNDLMIGWTGGNNHQPLKGYLYDLSVSRSGVTDIARTKMVRVGNVGYIYDEISGQLRGSLGSSQFGVGPDKIDRTQQYLTFVMVQSGTFSFTNFDLQYSVDGGAWTTLTAGTSTPTISAGSRVRWKSSGYTPPSNSVRGTFSATGTFDIEGNIMSLIGGDNFAELTEITNNAQFYSLFDGCSKVRNAEWMVLPATTIATNSYRSLFDGSSLVIPPQVLPATTVPSGAYQAAFVNCSNLIECPDIMATTLTGTNNMRWMFGNCTKLAVGPVLRSATLTGSCYRLMFDGCTKLRAVDMVATDISATDCLVSWLNNVGSGGILRKHTNTTLPSGTAGLPSGWTTQDTTTT